MNLKHGFYSQNPILNQDMQLLQGAKQRQELLLKAERYFSGNSEGLTADDVIQIGWLIEHRPGWAKALLDRFEV